MSQETFIRLKCDRCTLDDASGLHEVPPDWGSVLWPGVGTIDLCPSCWREVDHFIRNERELDEADVKDG